jgi:CDP-glucose 4,6-dehydratase
VADGEGAVESLVAGEVADANVWRGRKVLVTGHTGFKGGWLCLWLQHLGAEVSGYALAPDTDPNLFTVARVADGMASVTGDVADADVLAEVVAAHRPEVVFHLAAQARVLEGYRSPAQTYVANVMGTVNVLEAIRAVGGVRAVVVVTSDKCYANREWPWGYRERDPLGGFDPYSSSKACAELAAAAWRESFFSDPAHGDLGTAVATARAGNVVGGGDWAPDRLLPDLVRAAERGEAARLRHPDAVRPWQHVLDPLNGYLVLAERLLAEGPAFAEAWNFGPTDDDALPVRVIAARVRAAWDGAPGWTPAAGSTPHEAATLRLDASKARSRLGWRPRWSIETGIARAVDWYRAHLGGAEMRKHTLEQIEAFVHAPDG